MKTALCFIFPLILSATGYAQENPDDLVKGFFDTFQINSDKALDDIYSTNIWTSEMRDAINSNEENHQELSGGNGKLLWLRFDHKAKVHGAIRSLFLYGEVRQTADEDCFRVLQTE